MPVKIMKNNYSRKEQQTMDIARHTALKVIYEIEVNGAYSNIALSDVLNKNRSNLNNKDINFISELVYGTVAWKLTIDYMISTYSH